MCMTLNNMSGIRTQLTSQYNSEYSIFPAFLSGTRTDYKKSCLQFTSLKNLIFQLSAISLHFFIYKFQLFKFKPAE